MKKQVKIKHFFIFIAKKNTHCLSFKSWYPFYKNLLLKNIDKPMNKINFILELFEITTEIKQVKARSPKNDSYGDLEVIPDMLPVNAGNMFARKLTWLLLLALFSSLSASVTFDAVDLKKQAEFNGLGYKTANLIVLQSLASKINQSMTPDYVTVPAFVGISNTTIHHYLKTINFDLAAIWGTILKNTAGPHQRKKMLKRKQLNTKFRIELEALQESIINLFFNQPLLSFKPLQDFLHTAKQSDWSLMVRSTGKEDSEALANAGGNVSVANVPATDSHIMHAIGEVLASYVSVKSMQQRLQASDSSVFDIPFLPVLIQRMIGEPIGGTKLASSIPTGCVLYTTESDGFTPGIALVQSTFGHNEGVVQSSMPIDTFYLSKDITYASIKNKAKRLIPALEMLRYTLAEQPNPSTISSNPSLEPHALQSLYVIAQQVEKFYGKPMDLELVVMPHEQTIYLVQARPIVMPQIKATPRFLKDLNAFKVSQRIPCTIINSNRGMLLEKVSAHQLIMAKTLEKALTEFNNLRDEKEDILAIAVDEEAETTSHAAAVFRGEGKVIIRLESGFEKLEALMTQPQATIAISTQQGVIIDLTDQSLLTPAQIVSGLTSHPANIPLSITNGSNLWPHFTLPTLKAKRTVATILQELKTAPQDSTLLNELCAAVNQPDPLIVSKQLQSATKTIAATLNKKRGALQRFALNVTQEIKHATNKELVAFHLRMLELALTQNENHTYADIYSHESLHAYSTSASNFLNHIIEPAVAAGEISTTFIQDTTILNLAQTGYNRSLTPAVRQAWFHFLDLHARYKFAPQHARIAKLLTRLEQDDLLAGWINTSVVQIMQRFPAKNSVSYQAAADALAHEFESAQKQLITINQALQAIMNMQINDWEDAKKFEALFARLTKEVITTYNTPVFDELLDLCEQSSNNVLKLAVITALKKITDRYDLFIKAIKGSTQYTDKKTKIRHFHAMLEGYVKLLEKVCNNDVIMAALKERLNDYDEESEDELVISEHFNVNIIIQQNEINRSNSFSRRKFFDYIESLEDLFTTTHQLLLSEISRKIVAWDITKAIDMPEVVSAVQEVLELDDQLTGISFEGSSVIFTYNRKLRAHSIQIEVCYDCINKKVVLSYHFYGFNEFLRWNLIKDYVAIISPKLNLTVERVVSRDYGLSIYWHVPTTEAVHTLNDFLEDVIDITFELSIENRKAIFTHLEDTLENLYKKCLQIYKSPEALLKALTATTLKTSFNLLTLPALDEIAQQQPQAAIAIFQQGIETATQIVESTNHDNLVTAHYILAEITSAANELSDDSTKHKITLPKRTRLANYKTYHKVVSNLLEKVELLVDEI